MKFLGGLNRVQRFFTRTAAKNQKKIVVNETRKVVDEADQGQIQLKPILPKAFLTV